jgi:predicted GIY-YIG superfamily endonuclease
MTNSGIYLIKHKTIKNLVYVGKSVNIEQRWKQHRAGVRSAKKLQKAFKTYGIEFFEFSILEEIKNLKEMGQKETQYIDFYDSWKNGLNGSRAGGEWGSYARSFVKTPSFINYNGTKQHKLNSKKAGSIGGLRAKSNVYRMTHNNQIYVFVGTTIISQFLGINANTLRNWATNEKNFKVFSNSSIKILGKARDFNSIVPNTIYKEEKSGELLEVFRRV